MEVVRHEIRQDFLNCIRSSGCHNDKTSEPKKQYDKNIEVNKNQNDKKKYQELENELEDLLKSFDCEIKCDSEETGDQSGSDLGKYSDWDSSLIKECEEDKTKRNVKTLLDHHEKANDKLFRCYNYDRVKEEFEINAREFLMVKIENLKAVLNEYMLPFLEGTYKPEIDSFDRLSDLLCIRLIFLNNDKTDHFRFLCKLADDAIKNQHTDILYYNIESYLQRQLWKNPLCTFDYLCTGISDAKFESQLKLCYSKSLLCKNLNEVSDQSIETILKYFISSFDELTHNNKVDFQTKGDIFYSTKHVLNKFLGQQHVTNINFSIEVLQKIIRNFISVDCYEIFSKYMFRDRWSPQPIRILGAQWFKNISEDEDFLRTICGFVMEFQEQLKEIPKSLHTDMRFGTIIEENKCMLKCLLKTLSYISSDGETYDNETDFGVSDEQLFFHLDEEKEAVLPIYIDTLVDYSAVKGFVNIIKEFCDIKEMTWKNEEIILKSICDIASIRYHKKTCELAEVILNINLTQSKGDLLILITRTLWDLLKIQGQKKSQSHKNTMHTEVQHKTILYRCICILRNAKKEGQLTDVNISNYTTVFNLDEQSLENEDQVGKKSNTEIMLMIMLLLLVAATRHHKSAKLKKYLSQKYEYKEAILYILWCSGDIHINPGPPMKRSRLLHDSQRERAWIQDMSSILLKLYKGEPPHSKPKHLWREKPEHWPSNKPFYDTKNHPHDEYKCFISDNELLKCIIQCCDCKKVYINNVYRKEIAAWRENRNQLLYKLYTFRTETEKIKMFLQNFIIYKDTDELNEALNNINVKLSLKVGDGELKYVPCKRVKSQSEMIADITRFLATVVCKIIKGKDPETKCDGIWLTPPKPWPTNVPFFSPFNRGKCKYTCSDQLLLSTLLQHPKAVVPPRYKSLVESYQNVINSTDKKEVKKHKEVLCRVKTIQTDISVLDYALKYLHSDGFFTTEVCRPLHQWWTHENVENQTEITFANLQRVSEDRPKIRIEVTRTCVMLSVNMDYPAKSQVCYRISLDDSLPINLHSNSQHCSDVDQLFNYDKLQGTSVNTNSQIQHEQKSSSVAASLNEFNQGKDTTQHSFINNGNETDSSSKNETLLTSHKLLPVESNSLPLKNLKKSKEIATSITVKTSKGEETLARDSDGTYYPTGVSGINPHHTGQCDNYQRVLVPETNETQVFIEKQSKGKKRKLSNESSDNCSSKTLLTESDIQDDSVHKKTREETVLYHQFDLDFLLNDCINVISLQHDKSTSELSKDESSLGSEEDEIMDISLPVPTDYDEVSDGIAIQSDDLINFMSGKESRIEKELLLDGL